MSTPKRRLTKAVINFLSLCPRGCNRLPVMYKEDGDNTAIDLDMLTKASEKFSDNGEILAVVYAPELLDAQNELASAAVIKEAAYDAAKRGVNLDLRHNEKALPKADAYIAESFIVQKNDPRFTDFKDYSGDTVDVTGGWAVVLKIENESLRKAYRDKTWDGISMGGFASRTLEKSDDVLARLEKLLNPRKDDFPMDAKELEAILTKNNATLVTGIGEALAKAMAPKEETEAEKVAKEKAAKEKAAGVTAPVFKGDITDPKAVKAHSFAVKKFNLAKGLDFDATRAAAAEEARKASETALEAINKEESGEQPEKDPEVARLEKELADALKTSNQPMKKENSGTSKITKEQAEINFGKSIAAAANKQRGYAEAK